MKDNIALTMINRIKSNGFVKLQADKLITSMFINQNRKVWKSKDRANTGKHCYIDNWMPKEVASIVPQLVFAQGLAQSIPVEILVLSPPVDKEWGDFNSSFGARQAVVKKRRVDKLYGMLKALQLVLKREKGVNLLQVRYKGIPIGETLYDTIIRTTANQYTIDRIRLKNRKILYHFFSTISCVHHMFTVKNPDFYMPFERCHLEGALTIVAAYFGAKVIQCTANGRILYLGEGEKSKRRWHDVQKRMVEEFSEKKIPVNYVEIVEEYLRNRFAGKGNFDVINAFLDKKIVARSKYAEEAGLDSSKKNIAIMVHAFSDEPHGSEFLLYQDYYMWYEETLKIIQKIKNVNWIIRPHPSRCVYGEGDAAYNIFLQYQQDNMFWFSDEYSTASLAEIADAIITVQGTAGIEFSCLGKPIILCGRAFYSGHGFTIEPQTIEEYKHILSHLDKIQALTEEERENACKLMYVYLKMEFKPYDEFDKILVDSYSQDVKTGNNMALTALCENIKEDYDYYLSTKFYQVGKKMGRDIQQLPIGTMILGE